MLEARSQKQEARNVFLILTSDLWHLTSIPYATYG